MVKKGSVYIFFWGGGGYSTESRTDTRKGRKFSTLPEAAAIVHKTLSISNPLKGKLRERLCSVIGDNKSLKCAELFTTQGRRKRMTIPVVF